MPGLADPDAYLSRIGLRGPVTLARLHRAHEVTIPFENLDPYEGVAVSLDPLRLEHKLVAERRGGYCFEHNLLLMAALRSFGVEDVSPMLARVRRVEGPDRALNHLLLRVRDEDGTWIADVGFGAGGLLDPIPMEPGAEHDQDGWRYRLVEDGPELVLQAFEDGVWKDDYGFVPEPVPLVDVEVSNWYTATHPESPFVTGFVAGHRGVDRCLAVRSTDEATLLFERPAGQPTKVTEVAVEALPALLDRRFGLPGVCVGPSGRVGLDGRAGRSGA